jgi:hypothetical protein
MAAPRAQPAPLSGKEIMAKTPENKNGYKHSLVTILFNEPILVGLP